MKNLGGIVPAKSVSVPTVTGKIVPKRNMSMGFLSREAKSHRNRVPYRSLPCHPNGKNNSTSLPTYVCTPSVNCSVN